MAHHHHHKFFLELPLDLRAQIVDFLPQEDAGTLLQLSKAIGEAAAPCLHTLELPEIELPPSYRTEALQRLLARLPNLKELTLDVHEHDEHDDDDDDAYAPALHAAQAAAVPLVLAALQEGRVGGKLRRLSLRCSEEEEAVDLLELLKAGGLPCLEELELPDLWMWEGEDDEEKEEEAPEGGGGGERLAEALEARRRLGLPPLRRLESMPELDSRGLRRVWACMPPETVEYLEAGGGRRLEALMGYWRVHSGRRGGGFPALKQVYLTLGEFAEDDDEDEALTARLAGLWDALAAAGAPALEDLSLAFWNPNRCPLAPLGRAIGRGAFPALKALTLEECDVEPADLRAVLEGVKAYGRLEKLCLSGVEMEEAEVALFASMLAAPDGGLAHLKEVELGDGEYCEAAMALRTGAAPPCAGTLTELTLTGFLGFEDLVAALGAGAFPSLTALTLQADEGVESRVVMVDAPKALLARARAGTPMRLEDLTLGATTGWAGCIHELGLVFKADGLPRLTSLSVMVLAERTKGGSAGLFDAWAHPRAKIHLDDLALGVPMSTALRRRFLELLADPGFCPRLRYAQVGDALDEDVHNALEARRNQRDRNAVAAAAAAAAGAGGAQDA